MSKAINAGVEALSGFAFQRNCALYLILENYEELKSQNYFICIEHHDDLVFAYIDQNRNLINVDAYQAKKSTNHWTVNTKFSEILKKMIDVGINLNSDEYPKAANYSQNLNFLTNNNIKLTCGSRTSPEVNTIKESNKHVEYLDLHQNIKNNIVNKLNEFSYSPLELRDVGFLFIDLPRTDKIQKSVLTGMLAELFQGKITDPAAAMELVLSLFRNAETIYNQENISSLLDCKKRIESTEIQKAMDVICKKAKAYKEWRKHGADLAVQLRIPFSKSNRAEEYINTSFDYFKDLNEIEFQKIYRFVDDERQVDDKCHTWSECIIELHGKYKKEARTQLESERVLFAIVAAFVETREIIL